MAVVVELLYQKVLVAVIHQKTIELPRRKTVTVAGVKLLQ